MQFATLTVEPDGDEVRLETLQGRKHLVAPVVLVREGVLNGGFLSYDEIQRSEPGWNGRPVTAPPASNESGHPTDDAGNFVSANQDPYIDSMHTGRVRNVEARDDLPAPNGENPRGLAGEVWVAVGRAEDVGEQAIEAARRLAEGEKLEVSTGYWHAAENQSGEFEGESYEQVQFDLMPDHLALLPNETGACSWADGCGAPRAATTNARVAEAVNASLGSRVLAVNRHVQATNLLEQARTPDYEAAPEDGGGEWSAPDLADYVSAFEYEGVEQVDDLTDEQRAEVASTSLLGDANADSFAELVFFPVVGPDGMVLNENALDAVLSGRGSQADISDGQLQSARGVARTLLEDEFDRELADNVGQDHPVLARVKRLLGMADEQVQDLDDLPEYDPSGGCACGGHTGNCECGGHEPDENMTHNYEALAESTAFDLETLKDMSDSQIEALTETVEGNEDDGGDDGGADDGTDSEVEALREQVEGLTEQVEEIAAQASRDPQAEQARDYLAENTDHERNSLDEWPDDAALEAAQARGFGSNAGPSQGRVGSQVGVNRMGQAGAADDPTVDQSEDDLDGYVANSGALSQLTAAEQAGGD